MEKKWPTNEELDKKSLDELKLLAEQVEDGELKWFIIAKLIILGVNTSRNINLLTYADGYIGYAKQKADNVTLADAYRLKGIVLYALGESSVSLEVLQEARSLIDQEKDADLYYKILSPIASCLDRTGMQEQALELKLQVYKHFQSLNQFRWADIVNVSNSYGALKQFEKQLSFLQDHFDQVMESDNRIFRTNVFMSFGSAYKGLGDRKESIHYYQLALKESEAQQNKHYQGVIKINLATVFLNNDDLEEAQKWLNESVDLLKMTGDNAVLLELEQIYVELYKKMGDFELALQHHVQYHNYYTEVRSAEVLKKAHLLEHQIQVEQQEKEFEKRLGEARLKTLAMLASEMAHEIQNPLQFVNNFSAINLELLDDLDADPNDADARMDLRENCEKIQEHGQRISKIVAELQDKTNKAQAGELELPTDNVHDFSK